MLMTNDARADSDGPRAAARTEALYFDSNNRRLFGWLHSSSLGGSAKSGLVICKPFGYEAICSHRGTRAFAEAAAALGIPTLRFDFLGTGDSAEIDPQEDQFEAWSRDVAAAVEELRRLTGVERVCLLGFRLGGLLATIAADKCDGTVSSLILVAPVISGRRYVRELRTMRLAAMMGAESPDNSSVATSQLSSSLPGSMEVSGFTLSAATIKALSEIDLMNLKYRPAADMLIIDACTLPASEAWTKILTGLGVRTEYQKLPGLVQMLMTAPQFAKIPREMINAMCGWLSHHMLQSSATGTPPAVLRSASKTTILTLSDDTSTRRAAMTERPVFFGSDASLFGIVAEPSTGEKRRRAVILLNAGADYHIGASGMYVGLARRWARRGYVVLRMDFAGLGDSETRPGRVDDEVFPPTAIDDVRAALAFIHSRYGACETTLAGLCSGAYHALRAAVAEVQVHRILMINPQNYFWKEGMSVNDMQVAELVRNPGLYRARVFSLAAWKKLVTGQVNVLYISNIVRDRVLLALESTIRDLARRLRVRLPQDLGWELERIAARGVRMVFVFARGEPGIELLRIQAGSSVKRVRDRCHVHILDSGDHVFSKSGPRDALDRVLDDELFSRNAWHDAPPALELEHGS